MLAFKFDREAVEKILDAIGDDAVIKSPQNGSEVTLYAGVFFFLAWKERMLGLIDERPGAMLEHMEAASERLKLELWHAMKLSMQLCEQVCNDTLPQIHSNAVVKVWDDDGVMHGEVSKYVAE